MTRAGGGLVGKQKTFIAKTGVLSRADRRDIRGIALGFLDNYLFGGSAALAGELRLFSAPGVF